jgi:hypothetical protein
MRAWKLQMLAQLDGMLAQLDGDTARITADCMNNIADNQNRGNHHEGGTPRINPFRRITCDCHSGYFCGFSVNDRASKKSRGAGYQGCGVD